MERTPWLRVLAFTVPSVTLAVAAHVAAGGRPPDGSTVAGLLGCVALLGLPVGRRRQRRATLLAAVATVQVGVHIALLEHHTVAAPPEGVNPSAMTVAHVLASLWLAWWLSSGQTAVRQAVSRALAGLWRRIGPLPEPRTVRSYPGDVRRHRDRRSRPAQLRLRAPPRRA